MRFLWLVVFLIFFAGPALAADAAPKDALAQYSLGGQYLTGDGDVEQNDEKSVLWFRRAADQGLTIAQYYLSRAYADGRGVMQDNNEAYYWIVLASAGGEKFITDYRATLAEKMNSEKIAEIERRAAGWKPTAAGSQ